MTETRPQKRPRVPATLAKPKPRKKQAQTRAQRIEAVRAQHYARLALINSEHERQVIALRQQAQQLRRVENARYRKELEEAKAA